MYTLIGQQIEAADAVHHFMSPPSVPTDAPFGVRVNIAKEHSNSHRVFRIAGEAGVGKTVLTSHLVKHYANQMPVFVTAPTHKALGVLRDKITGTDACFSTIQSLLSMKPVKNTANGTEEFVATGESKIKFGSLIVLDEASMPDKTMLDLLIQGAIKHDARILLVGDSFQLPPVKQEDAAEKPPAFTMKVDAEFELTEIQRQAMDNPLIMAAHQYRKFLAGQPMDPEMLRPQETGLVQMDTDQLIETMHRLYTEARELDDMDHVRSTSFTNDSVAKTNQYVRAKILGYPKHPRFLVGDTVIANSAITTWDQENRMELVVVGTDALITIMDLEPAELMNVSGYWVTFQTAADGIYRKFTPGRQEEYKMLETHSKKYAFGQIDRGLAPPAAWGEHFARMRDFVDLRHPYALTVHKTQGSTYRTIIINVMDIMRKAREPAMQARLLYVALTRASETAIINRPLPILGSNILAA